MSESNKHAELVGIIVDYIRREHIHITAMGILDDLAGPLRAEKPSRIGGFVPDVHAFDAPLTTVIIGEAKTAADLETEHSRNQINAFMSYLSHQDNGIFILAVPWQAKRSAATLIEAVRKEIGANSVKTITLDDAGY